MMTEAPFSAASIAAGNPVAPAPTIPPPATLSQWRGAFAASTDFAPPTTAVAPTPVSAVLTKSLLDQPFFGCRCLATFSSRTDGTAQQRALIGDHMPACLPLVRAIICSLDERSNGRYSTLCFLVGSVGVSLNGRS